MGAITITITITIMITLTLTITITITITLADIMKEVCGEATHRVVPGVGSRGKGRRWGVMVTSGNLSTEIIERGFKCIV
jgi:hypothetical protein